MIVSVFVLWVLGAAVTNNAYGQTPKEIMEKNFMVSRVGDSESRATITLTNASGQSRVRKTISTTKLIPGTSDNRRLTRFLAPADIKGTSTLLVEHHDGDDDLWIYLPGLKKVRRLVSSNKKDSFVGTDFSYADIIGYRLSEWKYTLLEDSKINGESCFVVQAIPLDSKVRSDNGLAKRILWIRKDNFATVQAESYDNGGKLLKKYSFESLREVDRKTRKWLPLKMGAKNVQSNHRTSIVVESLKVNIGVKDNFFTTRYMEKEL